MKVTLASETAATARRSRRASPYRSEKSATVSDVFAEQNTTEGRKINGPRGVLETYEREPVLLLRMTEHGHKEFAGPLHRELDRWIASGNSKIVLFFDATDLASYDPELRVLWTEWVTRNQRYLSAIHLHTRSAVVTMGINLARAIFGKLMTPYSDKREFDKAFAAAKQHNSAPRTAR